METSNGLSGGLFSNMGSGMLELEMSLHPLQPQSQSQPQQNPHHLQSHQHLPIVGYGHHEADQNPQSQRPVKQSYPYAPKSKSQLTLSDEDEPGLTAEDSSAGDGSRKVSPWQRMKWTDSMVRLLIMVVFYIGDEAGSEGNDPAGKKKGGGLLQKKGKWKSVSRAMMERGFNVSPQQCEDKFNDLNKRYKRVNDILGKGTACQVVENQSLLETMDHLTPKRREEVRKLLNSKHLFFREMCAYHNSCGGGGGGGSGAHRSPEVAAEPSHVQQQPQQQRCFHSTENAPIAANLVRAESEGLKMVKVGSEEEDDDDEDDNDDDDEEEEDEVVEGGLRSHEHGHEEDDEDERCSKKRARKGVSLSLSPSPSPSPLIQQLSSEMMSVVQDGTKSPWEKRQWMKVRLMQLEEQRVGYQCEAFELEKQRLKWVKFSSKKEREMERDKLKNERMKLENERMVLLLRQKELDLIDLQQQQQQNCSHKRSDPSSING